MSEPAPEQPIRYPKGPCAHCQRVQPIRTRGLCDFCYRQPGVRDQYPAKQPKTGLALDRVKRPKPAARPTCHLPGTDGKIAVMQERLRKREELFHELDARPVEPTKRGEM